MLQEIITRLPGFPQPLNDALVHLILSHHGEYEFGSPRRPKTAEAMALHFADDMDAKMAILRDVSDSACGENWSPFKPSFGPLFVHRARSLTGRSHWPGPILPRAPLEPGAFRPGRRGAGGIGHGGAG